MHDSSSTRRRQSGSGNNVLLLAVCAAITLVGVAWMSPAAFFLLLAEGLAAGCILIPAVMLGLFLAALLQHPPATGAASSSHCPMPLRWHVLLGAMLGLGTIALLVFLLGLAGLLHRPLWIALLALSTASGVLRLLRRAVPHLSRAESFLAFRKLRLCRDRCGIGERTAAKNATVPDHPGAYRYLWLLLIPFLVLTVLAATTAPGLIWAEEGFGYDVLEYHLQLPKEHLEAGRITYLPHNVYANFPANVEMLYLLHMIVFEETRDAGIAANMIHLIFAVLFVFAAWVAGREWSPQAGVVCAVTGATAGWLHYLSGLAYVENGMLFFGMVAAAIWIRVLRLSLSDGAAGRTDAGRSARTGVRGSLLQHRITWIALAGLAAGFASGCKYTAVAMIAAPLAMAPWFLYRTAIRRRLLYVAVFLGAAVVSFSPWLIKNTVMTGNPVFPLANTLFKAEPPGWSAAETVRWNEAHRLPESQRTLPHRVWLAWKHLPADQWQRFGPLVFLLALGGLLGRRRARTDAFLCTVAAAQLAVWFLATHLFARFAVVLLIPLVLLAGRAILLDTGLRRRGRIFILVPIIMILGIAWNLYFAAELHTAEPTGGLPPHVVYEGRLPEFAYYKAVSEEVDPHARLLLVGEARAFYFDRPVDYWVTFNRNPFFEKLLSADRTRDVVEWLQAHGYTHVLVNWAEVRRLTRSYGFSPPVDEETLREWFDRLQSAGLVRIRTFALSVNQGPYVDLFAVPRRGL